MSILESSTSSSFSETSAPEPRHCWVWCQTCSWSNDYYRSLADCKSRPDSLTPSLRIGNCSLLLILVQNRNGSVVVVVLGGFGFGFGFGFGKWFGPMFGEMGRTTHMQYNGRGSLIRFWCSTIYF
ncbi:hypothetical protein PanWU01x14_033230 [Parasponia andersonii]|uniref:Uncharacterized protein n=1 Tax=Parasponia andersonii TaxID=3476 RepID=A0A2P5DTR7_PARAD|nr:hypothetical protein PanWU01x14_033230 [Parasponia andersonii]